MMCLTCLHDCANRFSNITILPTSEMLAIKIETVSDCQISSSAREAWYIMWWIDGKGKFHMNSVLITI